jgi:hypothetical protein
MAAIYSNGGNRWNILGFNFTKRDALSSVYKISMPYTQTNFPCPKSGMTGFGTGLLNKENFQFFAVHMHENL